MFLHYMSMMLRAIMICVLLFSHIMAHAQGTVRGTVTDKHTGEALQYVNVMVTEQSTGKMSGGVITDATGAFSIAGLHDGSYTLTVSFIGYESVTRPFVLSSKKRVVSLGAIALSEDSHTLDEVRVVGQRSQMKLEVDRKTFTADEIIAASGGSASDLLENIPSVEVTTDGEISLRGNTSVEVWINGKSSGLTADNRGDILQQLPAESIERIEVMDNPSAKFSAEGSAGIINIVLKRDRTAGYYGSLRAGVRRHWGWHGGGNINYSSSLLDAYANVGLKKNKNSGGSLSRQTYFSSDTYQNYETSSDNKNDNLFIRAGLTLHVTKRDAISLTGMTMFSDRDNTSVTPYHYGTTGAADTYVMYRNNSSDGDMTMYNIEADYTHEFSDKHKIDINVSFNKWKNDDSNYYRDSTVWTAGDDPTEYSYQYRPNFINNRSWEVKIDYENALTDKIKIEAGYSGKFAHENTPQESWTDEESYDGLNQTEEEDYFNRFIYDNDIHAAYVTASVTIGKLGVMAGLRGEYWKVQTESYDYEQEHDATLRDAPFEKDYFELFPSLFLNWQFNETAQLQLNYTRRLRRPAGGELNSFKNTSDASTVSYGNPLLTPEFTHSFSLNFLKSWDEHTLSVSVYYRPTSDVIQKVSYEDGGTMYSTNMNVSTSRSAGIELIGKDKLFRIVDLTTTVNAYYYKLSGFVYDMDSYTVTGDGNENVSWDARMLVSCVLPLNISLQATGNYRSRRVVTQGYRKANITLDLGLRKTMFNKKLALSVNWRDVFKSQKRRTHTSSDTFDRYQENWRDPRFNVTLVWNFGNMSEKKRHDTDTFDSDED